MARMIPPEVPAGTPSSERRIFELLRREPATAEWSVLHSVGLKRTRIGPYGEIDFVVLVPGKGICCLEVKGGEVSCTDGVWRTRNRKTGETATLSKSPYLQAREGMFALLKAVHEHFDPGHAARECPSSYAVIFPDVTAPPVTSEAEILGNDRHRVPVQTLVRNYRTQHCKKSGKTGSKIFFRKLF